MNKPVVSMLLSFFFLLVFTSAADSLISSLPQPNLALKVNVTTKEQWNCTFVVKIVTSCDSAPSTSDQIRLAFGDAYGNQVISPRLEDPSAGVFEQCSTDFFIISGPCLYQVCYAFFNRIGDDGYTPSTVTVYSLTGFAVTFYFQLEIPNNPNVWQGEDKCDDY